MELAGQEGGLAPGIAEGVTTVSRVERGTQGFGYTWWGEPGTDTYEHMRGDNYREGQGFK